MLKELRKHKRYTFFATAEMTIENKKDIPPLSTVVENISLAGIGVHHHSPIEKGTPIILEITYVNVQGMKMKDKIKGSVAWVQKEGGLYFMGIVFDEEINPQNQPELYDHFFNNIRRD